MQIHHTLESDTNPDLPILSQNPTRGRNQTNEGKREKGNFTKIEEEKEEPIG